MSQSEPPLVPPPPPAALQKQPPVESVPVELPLGGGGELSRGGVTHMAPTVEGNVARSQQGV